MNIGTEVRNQALPLRSDADLEPLMERIGDARVVLLGEASHGTHEYYAWRATITRLLIQRKGFGFVGVEGDWPDCYRVHQSVTGAAGEPEEILNGFERWPTWMWANREVLGFADWLRDVNQRRAADDRIGFYGLDVYSLWDSLRQVRNYLSEHQPDMVDAAVEAFRCFEPYAEDAQSYALSTRLVPEGCEAEVVSLLGRVAATAPADRSASRAERFNAEQNARAAQGAEAYYRAMVRGGAQSWNVRDRHMAETLDRLLEHHGPQAKAVVWEHNTHIGDARFTDMADAGMVNVGQLARERYGEDQVVAVGFGSHRGEVVAADYWGGPTRVMAVPPARPGSVEALLHDALDGEDALFIFDGPLSSWAGEPRDHRAIGVVYDASRERWGNYVPTTLGRRYDAFCWFNQTAALSPLHDAGTVDAEAQTWPSGA